MPVNPKNYRLTDDAMLRNNLTAIQSLAKDRKTPREMANETASVFRPHVQ
jgi:hypothetical protein